MARRKRDVQKQVTHGVRYGVSDVINIMMGTDIGRVYARGAEYAQQQLDHRKVTLSDLGAITGDSKEIVVMTREGLECLLRDAWVAGRRSNS